MQTRVGRVLTMLSAGFILGGIISLRQRPVGAYFELTSSLGCKKQDPYNAHHFEDGESMWLENDSSTTTSFICPLPDTSKLPIEDITEIQVEVHDENSGSEVFVKVCAASYDAIGGDTGSGDACSFTTAGKTGVAFDDGYALLTPDLVDTGANPILDAGETGYLYILLPATARIYSIRVEG